MKAAFIRLAKKPTDPLYRLLITCGAAWLITMISIPILGWVSGEAGVRSGTIAGVLLQVTTVVLALKTTWSLGRLAVVLPVVAFFAWSAEALGSSTGFPFGSYHYTSALQPQLSGVPLLIPLAWLMMLPPSWAVARILTSPDSRWAFAAISAAAITSWDLFLDPQMVAWGYWRWDQPGIYFGIPLQNYLGWFLVSFLITFLVNPGSMNNNALITIYTLTWLLESVGLAFFWRLPGPALTGFIGMGLFAVLSVFKVMPWRLAQPAVPTSHNIPHP